MKTASLLLGLCLWGCSKGEAPPAKPEAPAAPNVVTITAKDFSFVAPDTVQSGITTLRLVAENGMHHAMIVKLEEGKTMKDAEAFLASMTPTTPLPSWWREVGGPNPPAPGDTAVVTLDLTAGDYVLMCAVDVPDRMPHFAKGMMRSLTVVASATPSAPAPTSTIAMTMKDYGWDITPEITAGAHVIKVTNAGPQSHEFFIARLDSGKTVADFGKWAATYQGPPPGKALGGIAPMRSGETAYVHVSITPGNYLLLCFVPDAKDGKLHLEHGMVREFSVQ